MDYSGYMEEEVVNYLDILSAKFKNVGNPDRPLDEKEWDYLVGIVDDSHEIMVEIVADNRRLDIERVRSVSDGKTILGGDVLEEGLIDRVGGLSEALEDMDKGMKDACELYYAI
ncbi:MAG: S49 family peptidase [Patescibacteria group bacterium]